MKTTRKKPQTREQALERGFGYLNDEELVALMLGSGVSGMPVRRLARKVMQTIDDTNNDDFLEALLRMKGIGRAKALTLGASIEFGRRRNSHLRATIRTPSDAVPFVKRYSVQPKEHFLSITLNGGHEIIQIRVVSIGTSSETLAHPREIFCEALKENAAAIIVCHNHPSGTCLPSETDIETTKRLAQASELVGISLLDHIILDREGYYSFLEHKLVFSQEN